MPRLKALFDVAYGHSLELNRLTRTRPAQGIAFVSRRMGNNGISAWVVDVEGVPPAPAGELTCALSGNGVLTTHLQEQPFYTAFHVARLSALEPMTKPQLLFYAMCIKANRYRYSYGRQANRSLRDLDLPPLNLIPDYVEQANIERFAGRSAPSVSEVAAPLDTAAWRSFYLSTLFNIRKGKRLTKADMTVGQVPFVGAIEKNNGVRQYISAKPRHGGGVITVNYNGSVAEAFYQPQAFFASDDVNVLEPKFDMNALVALFVCAIIRQEKYRFNYGRKWNLERMRESSIRLPATAESEPDWDFMRRYMATLPFSKEAITSNAAAFSPLPDSSVDAE